MLGRKNYFYNFVGLKGGGRAVRAKWFNGFAPEKSGRQAAAGPWEWGGETLEEPIKRDKLDEIFQAQELAAPPEQRVSWIIIAREQGFTVGGSEGRALTRYQVRGLC